jgi:hypothetical protein
VESLVNILGCGVATLPVKYLGLPLGASYKSIHIWDGVIEKIERRLAWVTLANLPMYFLSLFPLPASVGARIEKLQQDFLWEGIGDEFKYDLVSWSGL